MLEMRADGLFVRENLLLYTVGGWKGRCAFACSMSMILDILFISDYF